MLLLDWEEFAVLCPSGTIFSFADPILPYERRGLYRKIETLYSEPGKPNDFTYIDLLPNADKPYCPWKDIKNYSIQMKSCDLHRWGEHDYDIKYIVFQKTDLELLSNTLKEAIPCH